jgi:heme-degrading monooxygenase HmoA
MNQVTEMFRLNNVARLDEALARLGGLFEVMAQQPGFLHAEVTRDTADDRVLLVFHAWARLEDWQAFQRSQWKLDFMAARPGGLYQPVPVGMNWTLVSGDEAPSGRYIRRVLSLVEPAARDGRAFREAMADACEAPRWMTLQNAEAPSGGDGWFEVMLTKTRAAAGSSV